MKRLGILFVISAPSGAGKSTICSSLRQTPDTVYSVSCTTRPPRAGEIDGEDYHFLDTAEFERRIAAGEFLEHARVHDQYYGTLRKTIDEQLRRGIDVLVDIDTQGAATIRRNADPFIRDSLVDIFIMPPDIEELRHRLRKRGTETGEQIERRLQTAAVEMRCWREYKYTIISGSMEEDLTKFRAITRAERYLSRRIISLEG
ncbi:MAG: guanylate kinase [Chthoniobacterales bacterium]|nr:guanylate kinase [Chthoniobacterales bacterium]